MIGEVFVEIAHLIGRGIGYAFETILFYSVPYVLFVVGSKGIVARKKMVVVGGYIGGVAVLGGPRPEYIEGVLIGSLGLSYFFCCAVLVHWISRWYSKEKVGKDVVFVIIFFVFVVIPAFYIPQSRAGLPFIGTMFALSSYSFCVEAKRAVRRKGINECLFFVLVDPTLVYTKRGRRKEGGWSGASVVGRMGAGVALTLLGKTAVMLSGKGVHSLGISAEFGGDYKSVILSGTVIFFSVYWLHSGMAHFQVGLMRSIGYSVPERYIYPFLARSPADFWGRWNTYVGSWFRRYVFYPVAVRLKQKAERKHVAGSAAVIATFASVGILHDVVPYLTSGDVQYVGVKGFLVSGVAIVVWEAIARLKAVRAYGKRNKLISGSVVRLLTIGLVIFNMWII